MDTKESPSAPLDRYTLADRYRRERGRVFLTGTQALVRLPLLQRALDRQVGLRTAGFISGYRGSPLGGYDQELWRAGAELSAADVEFLPAINEDLAATAILGTQQVETDPARTVDGVFSIWYGKGPGIDRAGDALKHGNAYGSSPHGGVLVVAGDDHGCVSSSMSHQSDVAFMTFFMPVLNPASVAEYLDFGIYGFALSRFSGTWVGFKAISETVESAQSVELPDTRVFVDPADYQAPDYGLHYRWPDLPGPQVEARMVAKLDAVRAFARSNPIDRTIYGIRNARFGIVTTGKAHLDLMEALRLLGIDESRARELGIDIYKVGLVWPLETVGARAFLRGKQEVLVVEEKRGIIESELKEALYDYQNDKPSRMVGKYDEEGCALIPWTGELSPSLLAPIVAARIAHAIPGVSFAAELAEIAGRSVNVSVPSEVKRTPYFCAGCPHSTSTKVPEGSKALAGIGCHFMASWMDRNTESLIQMGGEGVNWVGKSRFTGNGHVFQNLGEGTYFHSGYLAIRQAIAAGANITYKILFNNAVAMTGGQPVDGQLTVPGIAAQLRAEGVQRIAIVSDEPEKYSSVARFPSGSTVHHRDDLDALQRELREVPGVSALIYDQTCAAEKRRLRKKGKYPDPAKRVFINSEVCEGCGDCSVQSNCLAVHPVETELGRKRRIDQSSCNKDFSCLKGFCPSFVTVEGGGLRRPEPATKIADLLARLADLPTPEQKQPAARFDLLVAGIGGTGVVTVGALISMAAHLEGRGASVLDFTGFAQKGGAVISHIRLAGSPSDLNQVRVADGRADALIACDIVVGTDPRVTRTLARNRSRILINDSEVPSGQFVRDRNADIALQQRIQALRAAVGSDNVCVTSANRLMEQLLGNTVYANVFLLGQAWQQGLVPVSKDALVEAIRLNGVNITENLHAFDLGRLAAIDPEALNQAVDAEALHRPIERSLNDLIVHRRELLTGYQDAAYADRYEATVRRVQDTERLVVVSGELPLTRTVATQLYKLMAYKDEYEVARLYTDGRFIKALQTQFEGDYQIQFHLAPPLLPAKPDAQGRPRKRRFGAWMLPAFRLLARAKWLRKTPFDPFSWQSERREERSVIAEYAAVIDAVCEVLTAGNHAQAVACASLADHIRGFGPVKAQGIARFRRECAATLSELQGQRPAVTSQATTAQASEPQ
jgi:indolepyruvate ferredoxin oxidoreductase